MYESVKFAFEFPFMVRYTRKGRFFSIFNSFDYFTRKSLNEERVIIVLKNELLSLIEKKRLELFHVVSKTGLNSSAAIYHSQELDELLNKYNRIFIKKIVTT